MTGSYLANRQPQAMRGATASLADRFRLAGRLGETFQGQRKLDEALGYREELTTADYRRRYARNPVAARVVEAGPKGTWRAGCEVIETPSVTDPMTPFEKAMDAFVTRMNLWQKLLRADILAGLGRYATVLIGAPGALESPLPKMASTDEIAYLQPYAEDEMLILEYDEDIASPRFGKPLKYQLSRAQASAAVTKSGQLSRPRPQLTKEIHWTRIIHFADHVLDDEVYGAPRLERVWNKLDDLDKVTGGGAEAFWQNANRGIQFNVDPTLPVTEEEARELDAQADEYMHGYRRSMRTRGVEITPLGSDTADFAGNAMAVLQQIASGSGIPLRILIGTEAGELASTQDRSNWNDRVNDRRIESADPLVREFVDRLVAVGALPPPKAAYRVNWPRPEDMTEFERTEAASKMASANKDQVEATGLPIMTTDEIRERFMRASPLPEDVKQEMEQREEDARQAEIDAQAARSQARTQQAPAKRAASELAEIVDAIEVLQHEARDVAAEIVADAVA